MAVDFAIGFDAEPCFARRGVKLTVNSGGLIVAVDGMAED